VAVAGHFFGTTNLGGGSLTNAGGSDIFLAKLSPSGAHLWSKSFGSASSDQANGVAVDSSGDLVVTGYFFGTVDFGGGALQSFDDADIFLAKFSSGGTHLWSQRYGNSFFDGGSGVTVDSEGNIIMTGTFWFALNFGGGPHFSNGTSDMFVAKFSSGGTNLWSKDAGELSEDRGQAIAVDSSGNIVVAGEFEEGIDFGGGESINSGGTDGFLVKFGP